MITCELCGSTKVVKKGMRHNASGLKQKFFCHGCKKWYVHDDGFKRMRIKPEHIVRALHEYGDGASLKKNEQKFGTPKIKGRIHFDEKYTSVKDHWEYRLTAIDSKTKMVLAEIVVVERTLKECVKFLQQIKRWCYAQMVEKYKQEMEKPVEKRKLFVFVSDKFVNYKTAWIKLFSRITKLQFGVPIACKKFGLKHNN